MKDNTERTDSSRSTDLTDTGRKNNGIRNTKTKDKKTFDCEMTVLALGSRPDNTIVKELKEAGIEPLVIGDCNKVGKIADATKAAYLAAVSI